MRALCHSFIVDVASYKTLVKILYAGTLAKFKFPLRYGTLVVGRIGKENRVNKASDSWIIQRKLLLSVFAANFDNRIILVSVCIDASWFANSQLRDILSWLVFSFGRWGLRDELEIHKDGML